MNHRNNYTRKYYNHDIAFTNDSHELDRVKRDDYHYLAYYLKPDLINTDFIFEVDNDIFFICFLTSYNAALGFYYAFL